MTFSIYKFCGCKSYEDCDCEVFDINESQARVDEHNSFWDALHVARENTLADDWGDKWDREYLND